jgi:hypothetical protein
MIRLLKVIGIIVVLAILVPVGWFFFTISQIKTTQSAIIGFTPNEFAERATKPFFYSIGNELRFDDHIEPNGRVLFDGPLLFVLPSPDSSRVLVVSEDVLWILGNDGSLPTRITEVENLIMGRPAGKKVFRYTEIQWAEDSSKFYLIKDETYNSRGSQLFSLHGELTEYDIATGQMRKVFAPFRAFRYFMAKGIGIFFGEANDKGDVILTVGQGDTSAVVTEISPKHFRANDKTTLFSAIPFYSFSLHEYASEILPTKGISLEIEHQNPRIGHLSINGRRVISVSEGKGLKGPYLGFQSIHSGFLPGERYFMLNLSTGNFSGQLLFDLETGQYKPLPKDTRIYRNINTHNFAEWSITKDGVKVNRSQEKQSGYWY